MQVSGADHRGREFADKATRSKARSLERRVSRLKNVRILERGLRNVVVERAIGLADLQDAYRLVHDAFVEQEFISPSRSGLRLRAFEALPEMATFVAKIDGQVAAVMSALPDSADMGLPADSAFGEELDVLRTAGRSVCEITNDAVLPKHRNGLLFLELTRACFAHAVAVGCTDMFACITPKHATFFGGFLQFMPWGSRRSYSQEIEDLVEGNRLDLQEVSYRAMKPEELCEEEKFLREFYFTRNPYHDRVRAWQARARECFRDIDFLRELFGQDGDLRSTWTAEQLAAVERRWGGGLLAQVMGESATVYA